MEENKETVIQDDDSSYNLKSPFLKGEVVKDHVNRCLISRSKEMKKGYFNSSLSNSGDEVKEYISDTRKAFISSVKALESLLFPEINEESNMDIKEVLKKLHIKEKDYFETFSYSEKMIKNRKLEDTGIKYIPEEDGLIYVKTNNNGVIGVDKIKGVYNDKINIYWNLMVDIYDNVFSELNQLIHNKDYFNPEGGRI